MKINAIQISAISRSEISSWETGWSCLSGRFFLMGALKSLLLSLAAICLPASSFVVADELDVQEQAAINAAVDRVAPAVVRIETVGGVERVGRMLVGSGPTTGLLIDPEGYIISSAFGLANKPSSIVVRLADGTRKSAKIVATDHSRMLVLLKIDADKPLPFVALHLPAEAAVSDAVPVGEMKVGQWTAAVGRGFDGDRPNMAVGILSATNRVWGKAVQTDAAVSPNNYGGPLVDIRGRVLGVLAPLSPEAADEAAGIEWYDSGIGFAVPLEHVFAVLPRLKKGEDLRSGLAGVNMKGPNIYTGEPIVAACRPKGPAAKAGIKAGDKIIEINGKKVTRTAEVKQEILCRYAGDTMHLVLQRAKDRVECDLRLATKLEPFQPGFFGILPMRTEGKEGVVVRYVFPESPAAKAGIVAGDAIVSLDGEPVGSRMELFLKIGMQEPTSEIELETRHGDAVRKVKAALAAIPDALPPGELPPAHSAVKAEGKDGPPTGAIRLKVPEYPNEAWAYVPEGYNAEVPHGAVMWLHPAGDFDWPKLLARWKPLCDRYDFILIAPKAVDSSRWSPGEAGFAARLFVQVAADYAVDPARVVVHGQDAGGEQAFLMAFRYRELIRGVAVIEAAPPGQPPENDPLNRLSVYLATASRSPAERSLEQAVAAFQEQKTPLTKKSLGEMPRSLNAEELAELARWIDMLDRI